MQIKTFKSTVLEDIERDINSFLKSDIGAPGIMGTRRPELVDIKFSTAYDDPKESIHYSAILIYK